MSEGDDKGRDDELEEMGCKKRLVFMLSMIYSYL